MGVENVSFLFASRPRSRDWTAQELAEFYRVESALIQGGMRIVTDRGLSDEGDPWFIFCREDSGDPVVHFARIDGQYVIASPAYEGVARGLDFRSMVQDLISRHKLAPVNKPGKSNIFMHPAALLIIVVGTAFFKTPGEAQADEARKHAGTATDASSGFLDNWGRESTLGGDGAASLKAYGNLALNENMSQLLMVAASVILAADMRQAPAQAASVAEFAPVELQSVDGQTEISGVSNHLVSGLHPISDGFETIANVQAATSATELPTPSAPRFGEIASSALKLMADLNDIPVVHSVNLADQSSFSAKDIGLAATANSLNNETGFLAQKTAATTTAATTTELNASLIGGVSHAPATQTTQSNNFYANGVVVDQLPATLLDVLALANAATQNGNADAFLAGNSIYVDLHQAATQPQILNHSTGGATPVTTTTTADPGNHVSAGSTTVGPVSGLSSTNTTAGSAVLSTPSMTETLSSTVFLNTLDLFMKDTPAVGVYYSNDHYLFYNAADVTTTAANMESVSMLFTDGSSISIVGQVSYLNHILAHAQ